MKILLLATAFNGLTQRVWCDLRDQGHVVSVELALDPGAMIRAAEAFDPDLIICPFLKERVPDRVWRTWRTVIIHPGPVGDRGPSSLDLAIMEAAPIWGVTALQAVEAFDGGPIWASRTFRMPAEAPRKTALYSGPVTDAAVECVAEVVRRAADPDFRPVPLAEAPRPVPGTRERPSLRQVDRAFSWDQPAEVIVRRIRAADGSPGVRTHVRGMQVSAFDASPGTPPWPAAPGTVLGHADGAVLVAAGPDGGRPTAVWLGHLKAPGGIKLPATTVLQGLLRGVPRLSGGPHPWITYERRGDVGTLTFRPYNGALSTRQSRRLAHALRTALRQDTSVLVLRGADDVFCNGIHLNVIEASRDPAGEAWANIRAINAVCRRICASSRQLIVSAFSGNAGAGGVMLGLGGDVVVARDGVVLNPYYDMGIGGSELHTMTLPRRVGPDVAADLLAERLPVNAQQARGLGLVDALGPRDPGEFARWLAEFADEAARDVATRGIARAGRHHPAQEQPRRPLSYYETAELAEMARDIFDDRDGFADKRKAFVHKLRPAVTPAKLTLHGAA